MANKPAHVDLALEAAGVSICELEHRYVAMRLLLRAAIDEIRNLQRQLRIAQRYHRMDAAQIRFLMGIDRKMSYAHHHQVRS